MASMSTQSEGRPCHGYLAVVVDDGTADGLYRVTAAFNDSRICLVEHNPQTP
jgi:hypothetical protein